MCASVRAWLGLRGSMWGPLSGRVTSNVCMCMRRRMAAWEVEPNGIASVPFYVFLRQHRCGFPPLRLSPPRLYIKALSDAPLISHTSTYFVPDRNMKMPWQFFASPMRCPGWRLSSTCLCEIASCSCLGECLIAWGACCGRRWGVWWSAVDDSPLPMEAIDTLCSRGNGSVMCVSPSQVYLLTVHDSICNVSR